MPFGLGPNSCRLVPSGSVFSFEMSVHAPMSCSLADLSWLQALPESSGSANVVTASALTLLRQFITSSRVAIGSRQERLNKAILEISVFRLWSRHNHG